MNIKHLDIFYGLLPGCWFEVVFIFTPKIGEMIQFDEHLFSDGWFNHKLEETPWKINMELENNGLEDDFPFQLGDF